MTFPQAVLTCFKKYADFSGRAARSEYWYWTLFVFIANICCQILDARLALVFSVATLLPCIAVAVRRLHDIGKSGWWWLIAFIPLIGAIVLLVWFCTRGTQGPNRYGDVSDAGNTSAPTPAQAGT